LTTEREVAQLRPVAERLEDWKEVYPGTPGHAVLPIISKQAGRCMDCGTPFCHFACPLGNLIPEFNDLVWRDDWRGATTRLLETNNFPEITGRLCPAPCEMACVEGINREPVTIKNVEVAIADRAWADRRILPFTPQWQTSYTIAVVGSGPAGLAAAQQLTRAGHTVVVYERADKPGGLLRYGIPEFKLEKHVLDRRLKQMALEGTVFKTNVNIGVDITGEQLLERFDAVVLAIGSTVPRDLKVPGREYAGIHQAMEYLPQANRAALGRHVEDQISAEGLDVVIIGGGDTGADCLGTALRQQARSVTQLEIMPKPPTTRPASQPWPTFPMLYKVTSAHQEGGERVYSVSTKEFLADASGRVSGLRIEEVKLGAKGFEPVPGTERLIPAQLVLLAMGFVGPEPDGIVAQLGVELDARGNIVRDDSFATNVTGVYACGDAGRGQSLIVWAIAEGRSCAHGLDAALQGRTVLSRPIDPGARQLAT
jgi:glutamate synthase (NADPH/NADH) small chain